MKTNFNLEMYHILESLPANSRILLHSCCAPCSTVCLEILSRYADVTVVYYNPNIEPYEEYLKRKNEEIRFINSYPFINTVDIIDCDYDNELYKIKVKGLEKEPERGSRCLICYEMRLLYTAKLAKEKHYDYFATTLTLSPLKPSKIINEIGYKIASEENIAYLPSDFKKQNGYLRSIELSKEYNLYRQDFCGCIYSKMQKDIDK